MRYAKPLDSLVSAPGTPTEPDWTAWLGAAAAVREVAVGYRFAATSVAAVRAVYGRAEAAVFPAGTCAKYHTNAPWSTVRAFDALRFGSVRFWTTEARGRGPATLTLYWYAAAAHEGAAPEYRCALWLTAGHTIDVLPSHAPDVHGKSVGRNGLALIVHAQQARHTARDRALGHTAVPPEPPPWFSALFKPAPKPRARRPLPHPEVNHATTRLPCVYAAVPYLTAEALAAGDIETWGRVADDPALPPVDRRAAALVAEALFERESAHLSRLG